MWDEPRCRFAPGVLDVLEFRGSQIAGGTGFIAPWVSSRFGDPPGAMTPSAFAAFGLPDELPAENI